MPYADADTIIQAAIPTVSEPKPRRAPWVAITIAAWLLVAILALILAGIIAVDVTILGHLS